MVKDLIIRKGICNGADVRPSGSDPFFDHTARYWFPPVRHCFESPYLRADGGQKAVRLFLQVYAGVGQFIKDAEIRGRFEVCLYGGKDY